MTISNVFTSILYLLLSTCFIGCASTAKQGLHYDDDFLPKNLATFDLCTLSKTNTDTVRLHAEYFSSFEVSAFTNPDNCSKQWNLTVSFQLKYEPTSRKAKRRLNDLFSNTRAITITDLVVIGYLNTVEDFWGGNGFGHLGGYESQFTVLAIEQIGSIRDDY